MSEVCAVETVMGDTRIGRNGRLVQGVVTPCGLAY